ncbi:MAG: RDD family protein [Actinomycetota bacterium]|nr:RDD family protein [Actinomycetota bacterium]
MTSVIVGLIVGFILGIGFAASGGTDGGGFTIAANVVGVVIGFVIYSVYTGILMTRQGPQNGQTVGKQALGIRVVRTDGHPITLGTVAVRHWLMKFIVFGYLAILTLYIATLLNYLWPLWDDENRTFHDMAASTREVMA